MATPKVPARVVPPPSRTGEDFQIEVEIDGEVYIDRISVSSSSGIDDEIPLDEEYSESDEITLPDANDYYENCSRCEITVVVYGETRSGFQVEFEERRGFTRY